MLIISKNINKLDRKYSKFQNVRQFRNFPGFSLNISVPFCELIPNFELSSLKTARLWLWRSKIQPLVTHCRVNIAGQLVRGGSHLVEHSLHHFWTAHTSQLLADPNLSSPINLSGLRGQLDHLVLDYYS